MDIHGRGRFVPGIGLGTAGYRCSGSSKRRHDRRRQAADRIAKSALRYTNFHSTSLCSPTRAALITGRNHHVAGFGVVGEIATGFPGYNSVIRKENGTIGAILKENGYATSWFGKDHNTPFYQATQTRNDEVVSSSLS